MNLERREDHGEMQRDIAVIKNDISYIKQSMIEKRTELNEHTTQDRWLFGVVFTFQIAILTKMMGAW